MAPHNQCGGYARAGVKLADLVEDQQLRDQLLDMARKWMRRSIHKAKAGLAMDAGDDVDADRCSLLEACEENIVANGINDTGDTGHVEFERSEAVLARIVRHFGDLLVGEYLEMEDRVDVAHLIHGAAEYRKMQTVRILEAPQHNPDGGDAAKNCRALARQSPFRRPEASCGDSGQDKARKLTRLPE